MLDFDRYEALTFDCYGTLVDWESGILKAMGPLLSAHDVVLSDAEILRHYAEYEANAESGEYTKYREVLRKVVDGFGYRFDFVPSESEADFLANSIGAWPVFWDTVESLRRLKTRYRLGIISNVDDDLFAGTAKLLEVAFDWVVTAEQAQSYKPSLNNFTLAMKRMRLPKDRVLHVAESVRHDIVPAKAFGLDTVWVNRGKGLGRGSSASGAGAATVSDAEVEVPDLQTLVEMMGLNS